MRGRCLENSLAGLCPSRILLGFGCVVDFLWAQSFRCSNGYVGLLFRGVRAVGFCSFLFLGLGIHDCESKGLRFKA